MFEIPSRFNKNAPEVRALGSQAQTGKMLLEYMCQRMGIQNLKEKSVLDLGCGARFTDSIVNLGVPIGSYFGVDIDSELIRFFQDNLDDNRFNFACWNARNPLYNPYGELITANSCLPIPESNFDIACMFSVITHQLPNDAASILTILKKYVKNEGHLFFSAGIYADEGDYMELHPNQTTGFSGYSRKLMESIIESAGWKIVSFEDKQPRGLPIQASFLCSNLP